MVDWNRWKCRNCLHWHHSDFKNLFKTICVHRSCGCNNWESNDNLFYLENKYEKSLNWN